MMKFLVAISLLAAVFSLTEAQNPCDMNAQIAFVLSLEDPESCGANLARVEPPVPNTPESRANLTAALDVICNEECAGAVSDWLLGPECSTDPNSTFINYFAGRSLEIFCQPVENADISRCRFTLDVMNESLVSDDLFSCSQFANTSMCPSTCASALQSLSQGIGCCYQSIFNNTMILAGLVQNMAIDRIGEAF